MELETAGIGFFCWSRLKSSGSGLMLRELGVLWWQSCDNSYNYRQILTMSAHIKRKNIYYTFIKNKIILFFKNVYFKICIIKMLTGAGGTNRSRVTIGPAPQYCLSLSAIRSKMMAIGRVPKCMVFSLSF